MEREEVYKLIDSEREYQKKRWGYAGWCYPEGCTDGTRQIMGFEEINKPTESFILYMEEYLEKARAAISSEPSDFNALEHIRKVVALGVACMEQHNTHARNTTNIINGRDGNIY